eukprot:c25187_g1_i3 orf=413-2740(-)
MGAKYVPVPSEPDSLVALTAQNESSSSQTPLSQPCTIMHMDIEGESPAQSSRTPDRRCGILKACCGSTFILVAAILVGFSISTVSFKLTGWSARHEQEERKTHYHHHFVETASRTKAAQHLKELTRLPHVAGSSEDMATAAYVQASFEKYGMKTHLKDYEVLLSYPLERSVTLSFPNGSVVSLSLREEPLQGESNSTIAKATPPFHAYAPSGNVTAEVVYANYGRQEDYTKLEDLSVNVSGKVVIVRYGEVFRGDVVSIAANAGASAVILYSDPKDFAGGGKDGFFPDAKWLPPTGVQRGTVFQGVGDPLTPGWPSTAHGERLSDADVAAILPRIPSLPISADDAWCILSTLGGVIAPPEWHGDLHIPQYRVGAGAVKLNLIYTETKKLTMVRNVFGVIEGAEEPDRYVLLGNHRDAWTFGAVDPSSGTAALLEIARRFGMLRRRGWQPRRTIILCSWDAEEYGTIGSTEWVEQNIDSLAVKAIAYLNVDCAVAGPGFYAAATPQLDNLLKEVTKEVHDPDIHEKSVYDMWAASTKGRSMVTRLGGGGSDFTSFLQHAGVPSMDIYFGKDYPVYHSLYDNFYWIEKFGDPTLKRLIAAATIWGLTSLRLADDLIIPFHYKVYAEELEAYTKAVEQRLAGHGPSVNVTVEPILSAIEIFEEAIAEVEKEAEIFYSIKMGMESSTPLVMAARVLNDRLLLTERAFLDNYGLMGAVWHKHLVYGPSKGDEYSVSFFPGINAAISNAAKDGTWSVVQHEVWKVSRAIERATLVISGQLT